MLLDGGIPAEGRSVGKSLRRALHVVAAFPESVGRSGGSLAAYLSPEASRAAGGDWRARDLLGDARLARGRGRTREDGAGAELLAGGDVLLSAGAATRDVGRRGEIGADESRLHSADAAFHSRVHFLVADAGGAIPTRRVARSGRCFQSRRGGVLRSVDQSP